MDGEKRFMSGTYIHSSYPNKIYNNSKDSMEGFQLVERNYGKNYVKVLHVGREGKLHTAKEVEVSTRLTLKTNKDFLKADNSDIIATDSQKNIVYVLAKKYGVKTPEDFGILVCEFFLGKYRQVEEVEVTVEEYPWQRMPARNKPHNHAFIFVPTVERYAIVNQKRDEKPRVKSGLKGLRVLKTTQSAFTDFYSDEYRTLGDAQDRIFSTVITAAWIYSNVKGLDFDREWAGVMDSILEEFAGNPDTGTISQSVQHTLYMAEKHILEKHSQIEEINLDMPNKHYWNVDLSCFPEDMVGKGENKTVFIPVDKPSGHIHAVLTRQTKSKL